MTQGRLLFDECIGRPLVLKLAEIVAMAKGDKPEILHYFDMFPSGTHDEEWIPKLASENITIVTTDGGRTPNKKRGEKLPHICMRLGITHILISPNIHGRTSFEKLLTFLSVWYDLAEIASNIESKGKRFVLEPPVSPRRGHGRVSVKPFSTNTRINSI